MNGIKYEITGNEERGQVTSYHSKPSPNKLNYGAKNSDIAQLPKKHKRNLLQFGQDYQSKFTIGFEVEKTQLHRNSVREYELFCGFERDGSCGYEAVTHILPLLPPSVWRNKVYDMMHKASKIIDDQYSPSDSKCGGHITIGYVGMDGEELLSKVRKFSGIIYALYKRRLSNHYCRYNLGMDDYNSRWGWSTYNNNKYQVALDRGFGVEFRLPSRFTSVKSMMRRYELFYELVDFSVNNPKGSQAKFFANIRPIVMSMYENDSVRVDEVFADAVSFQKMINTGKITSDIRKYVDPDASMEERWV